jgi:hypothetical protein
VPMLRRLLPALLLTIALPACSAPPDSTTAPEIDPAPGDALAGLDGSNGAAETDGSGSAGRDCTDDALEDDDDALSANPLAGPTRIDDLVSCEADEDHFELVLLDGDVLTAQALFAHAEGNIDLELRNVLGTPLATSASTTSDESVTWTAIGNQTVRLVVWLTADLGAVAGSGYSLDVSVTNGAVCVDDALEDDDDAATATPLPGAGLFGGGVACDADFDFYEISLIAGDELTLDTLFDHAEGDINVVLQDASGGTIDTGTSASDHERVAHIAAGAEQVFFRVELFADTGSWPGNEYDLDVAIENWTVCQVDPSEDDDTPATANVLTTPGLYEFLSACDGDPDWFEIDLFAGETLTLDVLFQQSFGDLDIELQDLAGGTLATGTSSDDDESVSWTATIDETVRLRVDLIADLGWYLGNRYALVVTVTDPATCRDDAREEDDDATSATFLPDRASYPGGVVCPSDVDWFELQLFAGEVLSLATTFVHAEGDIDVELYDSAGGLLDASATADDVETVGYATASDELVRLRVELVADSGSAAGNSYVVDVGVMNLDVCVPDVEEDNDTPAMAAILPGAGYFGPLTACDTDEDWFEFDLEAAQAVSIDLFFEHAEGDIDVELKDVLGNTLAVGDSTTDNELIQYGAVSPQTVRAVVTLVGDAGIAPGNSYDFVLTTLETFTCVDDAMEDNDGSLQAVLWSAPGLYEDLVACSSDWDWFEYDLDANETATFDVLFAHADGDIDVELQDELGNVLTSSASATDDEQVSWTAVGDQKLFLIVDLTADQGFNPGNAYSVELTVGSPYDCVDDVEEDNDTAMTATTIAGPGALTGLVSCQDDTDWFEIDLLDGQTLTIDAFFAHAEGNVELVLKDVAGTWLVWSFSLTDDEQVVWTAAGDQTVRLQVDITEDWGLVGGSAYDLDVTIE